ncbi:MAG: thiol peroxidase, partial [Cyanobacteria bacterium J06598_3]
DDDSVSVIVLNCNRLIFGAPRVPMSTINFKQTPVQLLGDFPKVGQPAPDFKLVKGDLSELTLSDLKGKRVVLNTFPSVDTDVCALQLKTFNQKVADIDNTLVVSASMDLPFALGRFCGAEGVENAITASDFRHRSMAESYGVGVAESPLQGLYARSVIILNESHEIIYAELVSEVTTEPNYEAAMAALR